MSDDVREDIDEEKVESPDSEVDNERVESPESDVLPEERITEEEESPDVDDDSEGDSEDGDIAAQAKAPAADDYEPDFTYRVKDDEFEMPDRIKEFIKTPEDEEYFRDLLTAADGVPGLVEDRQILRDDNARLMQVEQTRQHAVNDLLGFVKQGDLKPFMDTWNISDEQLAKYMQHRLQLHELRENNPQQYAEYERNEQARLQNMSMQTQYQSLQAQNSQLQAQQLEFQMNQALTGPELNEHVQSYDSAKGPGSFKKEVIALGDYYYRAGRGVVPPEQLAREVASKWYNPASQPDTDQHARQGAQTQRETRGRRVVERQSKPTIKKVRGGSGSPVKSTPRSFADLKKIREQRYGN